MKCPHCEKEIEVSLIKSQNQEPDDNLPGINFEPNWNTVDEYYWHFDLYSGRTDAE
jgi:hypothetical protein